MSLSHENIERLYKLGLWPFDPESQFVKKRYSEALSNFRELIKHEWFKEILNRKNIVRILEICSGNGLGGIALAKILKENDKKIELILSDVMEEALRIGEKWGSEELGEKVSIININALLIHKLRIKRDIVLMYGLSASHFSPWEFVKLLSSISEILEEDGLLIIEEVDRTYSIFLRVGYKDLVVERHDEPIISLHSNYDSIRGIFERTYINLLDPSNRVKASFYYWNIAELMTLVWLYFQDVDFFPYDKKRSQGLIIGYRPRYKIKPIDLEYKPRVLKNAEEEKD